VRVRTTVDGKEHLLPWPKLSEADRLLLATLKEDARYLPPPPPVPIPPRKNAELERLRAARFAASVFIGDQSARPRLLRWGLRPKLDVRAETPEIEALIRNHYDELCAAAGFTGMVDPEHVIIFAAGSPTYLKQFKNELSSSIPHQAGDWYYRFTQNNDGTLKSIHAMVGLESRIDPLGQRMMAQCMGASFGARVMADPQWQDSVFIRNPSAVSFTEADRRLFRIIYRHVPASARKDEILMLVPRHWINPDAEPDAPAK
jgi:hypothetical protein